MFVYNPLSGNTELFALYESANSGAVQERRDPELLRGYRSYALGLHQSTGLNSVPAVLVADDRKLVRKFRAFLPVFLEMADSAASVAKGISVEFPSVSVSDARADLVAGRKVAYVTSGKLDAIELFADTVSTCAGLNLLALPALIEVSNFSGEGVPLAWLSLRSDTLRGMSVSELLTRVERGSTVDSAIHSFVRSMSPRIQPGYYAYLLSYYLMQLLMRQIRRSAGQRFDHRPTLHNPLSPRSLIDRDYLAVLTLSFVVLHEVSHHPLQHNTIGFQGWPHEIAFSDALTKIVSSLYGPEAVLGTPGSVGAFELKADSFPLEITPAALREPLLEAASLWIATHERGYVVAGNRFDDLLRMGRDKEAHPSPALRVWTLNGRFSTGIRQGDIACRISDYAEDAAAECKSDLDNSQLEVEVYQSIWDHVVALAATGQESGRRRRWRRWSR
jgi:hypothetical protein